MPIYAYRCRSCGVQFERFQTFTDVALRLCPECRKKTLQRIISLVRIGFKGPGFYSTDNRSSSPATLPASAQKEQKKRSHKEKTQPENANTSPEKNDQG
jgi:putative FmdB family regulatory protein